MRPPTPDPYLMAKRYIDLIIAVNRKHGATEDLSTEHYRDAIKQAAGLFDAAQRRKARDSVRY